MSSRLTYKAVHMPARNIIVMVIVVKFIIIVVKIIIILVKIIIICTNILTIIMIKPGKVEIW